MEVVIWTREAVWSPTAHKAVRHLIHSDVIDIIAGGLDHTLAQDGDTGE